MSSIAHGMKKRLSLVATRSKTIEAGMPAEYTSEKHDVLREKASLEKALELVLKGKAAWKDVASTQKSFGDLVSADAPVDSTMHTVAAAAGAAANGFLDGLATPEDTSAGPARLEAHVRAYIAELSTIEKEFKSVESRHVEVSRYERKVGKLNDRAAKAEKAAKGGDKAVEKTRRNLDKLESERAAFQSKMDGVIEMMKKANAKYEKVLHCAHGMFWLSQHHMMTMAEEKSESVRKQVRSSEAELVALDISAPKATKEANGTSVTAPAS